MQCELDAVEGDSFCVVHGANVERSAEEIRRNIVALQFKSVRVIEEVMLMGGNEDRVRLAAALSILDRTGFGPKSTVAVENQAEDVTLLSEEQLITRAEQILRERNKRRMNVKKMSPNDSGYPIQ